MNDFQRFVCNWKGKYVFIIEMNLQGVPLKNAINFLPQSSRSKIESSLERESFVGVAKSDPLHDDDDYCCEQQQGQLRFSCCCSV